tara:strand:- start:1489 stop:1779 length:291 start_codon:yes stop_codon:yes gene_type:complete
LLCWRSNECSSEAAQEANLGLAAHSVASITFDARFDRSIHVSAMLAKQALRCNHVRLRAFDKLSDCFVIDLIRLISRCIGIGIAAAAKQRGTRSTH